MAEKIKVAVIEGPKEIADFLGDNIVIVDDVKKADIIFFAQEKDISPEYYGQSTKDESRHDPVKDSVLLEKVKYIRAYNRCALLVGVRGGAGFLEVHRGCVGRQSKSFKKGELDQVVNEQLRGRGYMIPYGSSFKVPMTNNYGYVPGSSYLDSHWAQIKIGSKLYNFISYFSGGSSYNRTICLHIDPLMIPKDHILENIFKAIVLNESQTLVCIAKAHEYNLGRLSDQSIWSSRSTNEYIRNYQMESHACFGQLVKYDLAGVAKYDRKAEVTYKIKVMKPNGWNTSYGRCVTFFKYEEYEDYYKRLQQIYPFEYSVDESNDDYIIIDLKIDACCMWHKIILTQLRYIYQYPMHFILKDALELKKLEQFKDMDIIDLLSIVAKTISPYVAESGEYMIYPYYGNNGEDATKIIKPFNEKEFLKLASEHSKLHERPSLNDLGSKYTTEIENFKFLNGILPCCCNWEVFCKTFEDRFPFYLHNIKQFKKLIK